MLIKYVIFLHIELHLESEEIIHVNTESVSKILIRIEKECIVVLNIV